MTAVGEVRASRAIPLVRRRRRTSLRARRAATAYVFLLPAMTVLFVFVIWPILDVFGRAPGAPPSSPMPALT